MKDSFNPSQASERSQNSNIISESVLIFDFPTISDGHNKTERKESSVIELLNNKSTSKRQKLKSFNHKFKKKTVDIIEEESHFSYLNYIENKFRENKIKKSEYKILIKFLINYLETENKPIIANAGSGFKHKIRTLISDL